MNTSKFLHTRAEFTQSGTNEKHYGWVQNIRSLEISISVPKEAKFKVGLEYRVRLSSEIAVTEFEACLQSQDSGLVSFRLPLPLHIEDGDKQARVQVRGQFAFISTLGLDFVAELEDVSLGGMAFVIPIKCEPGSQLLARLPGTADRSTVPSEVRYCLRLPGQTDLFRVGVQFLDLSGSQYDALRRIMMNPISRSA